MMVNCETVEHLWGCTSAVHKEPLPQILNHTDIVLLHFQSFSRLSFIFHKLSRKMGHSGTVMS